MKLQQLAYISTAVAPMGPRGDIDDILAQSVRNNPANNITGALAFTANRFVQLLEGSQGSLDVLILKLMIDPRHRDLIFIDRSPIEARSFENWSMVSPVFTPEGDQRLAVLINESGPIGELQRLLLGMLDEQAARRA